MAKILIVDDNDLVRATTRGMLQSAGHDVEETGDGNAAVELVRQTPPDLVLTDLVMPIKTGVDLIRELRRTGYEGAIIAMSGGGGELGPSALLSMAREQGADDCVSKPFHRADLFAKVTAALERRGSAS
jgi:DNA-binding response OmpR family regulator